MNIILVLVLDDIGPGKRSQTEASDLIAGADDSMLLDATQTLDGVAQKLNILAFVVNSPGTVTSLIANDGNDTNVAGAGLTKGSKNIVTDLSIGTFIQAGKYKHGRSWNKVIAGTASIIVYYNYVPDRTK